MSPFSIGSLSIIQKNFYHNDKVWYKYPKEIMQQRNNLIYIISILYYIYRLTFIRFLNSLLIRMKSFLLYYIYRRWNTKNITANSVVYDVATIPQIRPLLSPFNISIFFFISWILIYVEPLSPRLDSSLRWEIHHHHDMFIWLCYNYLLLMGYISKWF